MKIGGLLNTAKNNTENRGKSKKKKQNITNIIVITTLINTIYYDYGQQKQSESKTIEKLNKNARKESFFPVFFGLVEIETNCTKKERKFVFIYIVESETKNELNSRARKRNTTSKTITAVKRHVSSEIFLTGNNTNKQTAEQHHTDFG